VHWDGECLHEQGVLADYAEEWLWQWPDSPASQAWVTADGRGLRVVVGEWFMQAAGRRQPLPIGTSLAKVGRAQGPISRQIALTSLLGRIRPRSGHRPVMGWTARNGHGGHLEFSL